MSDQQFVEVAESGDGQTLSDMLTETASLQALIRRFNARRVTWGVIMNLADESSAVSMECAI